MANGKLEVEALIEKEKIHPILTVIAEVGTETMSAIKSKLGDEFTFSDIRVVLSYHSWKLQESEGATA